MSRSRIVLVLLGLGLAAVALGLWLRARRPAASPPAASASAGAPRPPAPAPAQNACGALGPLSHGFSIDAGGLPGPGDKRAVKVEREGYVLAPDGSLLLDPGVNPPQPVYRVVLAAACPNRPSTWKLVTVERELQEMMTSVGVSVRSGATPVPDDTWSAASASLTQPSNELAPRLSGKYIELSFTLLAAERQNGPSLRGFRVCYACGAEGRQ